jgi:hypothetical protein
MKDDFTKEVMEHIDAIKFNIEEKKHFEGIIKEHKKAIGEKLELSNKQVNYLLKRLDGENNDDAEYAFDCIQKGESLAKVIVERAS